MSLHLNDFLFLIILFVYLFLAMLGLHCCVGFSLVVMHLTSCCGDLSCCKAQVLGLQWLLHVGSVVVAPRL